MARIQRTLETVLSGRSDRNVRFEDLRRLVNALGFNERIKGDHHIYSREDVEEIINLQPGAAGVAKPYQVRQVRRIVTKYAMGFDQ